MKKQHFTRAQLNALNNKVIAIGYCGAQNLLRGLDAYAYNRGLYGWNWDAYYIGEGVTVCTGYRNLTGESVKYSDLEERAEKIASDYSINWRNRDRMIAELRAELVARALNS